MHDVDIRFRQAPQGKAKKKDKKRAPPSPSPTPVAGPSDKRVDREVSKKREVLVLDNSDEEDVKPRVRLPALYLISVHAHS